MSLGTRIVTVTLFAALVVSALAANPHTAAGGTLQSKQPTGSPASRAWKNVQAGVNRAVQGFSSLHKQWHDEGLMRKIQERGLYKPQSDVWEEQRNNPAKAKEQCDFVLRESTNPRMREWCKAAEVPLDQRKSKPVRPGDLTVARAPGAAASLLEVEGGVKTLYFAARAFIPGKGTAAAKGVNMDLKLASDWDASYNLPADPTKSYGGYAPGCWETDTVFNTNHRDYSFAVSDNAESKAFAYYKFELRDGRWSSTRLGSGFSETKHYNNGFLASGGLCCHRALMEDASNYNRVEVTHGNSGATRLTFSLRQAGSNPCAVGSSLAKIASEMSFSYDFARQEMTFNGKHSCFPAWEFLWGARALSCTSRMGVRGRSPTDLMFNCHHKGSFKCQ